MTSLISAVVPATVAGEEALGTPPGAHLLPEEEAALGAVGPGRRQQYTIARTCGRLALRRLGLPEAPILRGASREPVWPAGVVGSLTHCAGYCAAAVARDSDVAAVGIDAEPHGPLPRGVLERIAIAPERDWLRGAGDAGVCFDRVLFSAKESVYKAWFPLARRWLGFHDAHVEIDPAAGTFRVRLLVPGPVAGFDGRYVVARGLIVTAVTVPL